MTQYYIFIEFESGPFIDEDENRVYGFEYKTAESGKFRKSSF